MNKTCNRLSKMNGVLREDPKSVLANAHSINSLELPSSPPTN